MDLNANGVARTASWWFLTKLKVMDWLRRHRRYFLYPIVILTLVYAQPPPERLRDNLLDGLGLLIALFGQGLRVWAWATNAASSGLRINGPYACLRHPLYMGNYLIALGLLMIFNAPLAYFIVLPSLGLLCWLVATEEEKQLERKWGEVYANYRAEVPRFLPWRGRVIKARERVRWNWQWAWGKEQESICALLAGTLGLELYKHLLAGSFRTVKMDLLLYFLPLTVLGLLMLGLRFEKKSGKGIVD